MRWPSCSSRGELMSKPPTGMNRRRCTSLHREGTRRWPGCSSRGYIPTEHAHSPPPRTLFPGLVSIRQHQLSGTAKCKQAVSQCSHSLCDVSVFHFWGEGQQPHKTIQAIATWNLQNPRVTKTVEGALYGPDRLSPQSLSSTILIYYHHHE